MIDLSEAPQQVERRMHRKTIPSDPIQAFQAKMFEYQLDAGIIDTSGKLTRFDIDKKNDLAGWYVFFLGEISAGAFGSWKTGTNVDWCSIEKSKMSDSESSQYSKLIADAKQKRYKAQKKLHKEAKKRANEIWNDAKPVKSHEYLNNKNVNSYWLRESRGSLVIPILDTSDEITSLQFIKPNGKKRMLSGGKKNGNFFLIPGDNRVFICEGYSTGASIHSVTGGTVVCAIDAGNIPATAKNIRKKYPTAQITICADTDRFTAGNPGLTKAKEAATEIGSRLAIPNFDDIKNGDSEELKYSDFNDLLNNSDAETVKKQIFNDNTRDNTFKPLSPNGTRAAGRLTERPKPIEFIFKYNDHGLIPRGIVGVLTAAGGTGKTFFLLSLAMAGAGAGSFGPINSPNIVKTLVIVGEDSQDELDRRLWDIGKGSFPEHLYAASVYGELGPLMRLDGSTPVYADAYFWLEETIKKHAGVELIIIDPKSRFYGLDENNNDHATRWIQCLEALSKKYNLTILFSHHTGKDKSDKISQGMGRGASAIVDGCRWQAGIVRMSEKEAIDLNIENCRDYIVFDAPKANYSADVPRQVYFKRGENGVLEFAEPWLDRLKRISDEFLKMIKSDPVEYSIRDLVSRKEGKGFSDELTEKMEGFNRKKDMSIIIRFLLKCGKLKEVENGNNKKTLKLTDGF